MTHDIGALAKAAKAAHDDVILNHPADIDPPLSLRAFEAAVSVVLAEVASLAQARLAEVPARYSDSDEAADGAGFELQWVVSVVSNAR